LARGAGDFGDAGDGDRLAGVDQRGVLARESGDGFGVSAEAICETHGRRIARSGLHSGGECRAGGIVHFAGAGISDE